MSRVVIQPGRLGGVVSAIPSKSEAHRVLIAAALSRERCRLCGMHGELSEDIAATIRVLHVLFGSIFTHDGAVIEVRPNPAAENLESVCQSHTFGDFAAARMQDGMAGITVNGWPGGGRVPRRMRARIEENVRMISGDSTQSLHTGDGQSLHTDDGRSPLAVDGHSLHTDDGHSLHTENGEKRKAVEDKGKRPVIAHCPLHPVHAPHPPHPAGPASPSEPVADCGESGTTLRMTLPVAAASLPSGGSISFTGSGRLPQRPLGELLQVLRSRGVCCSSNTLPLSLSGKMAAGDCILPGDVSSQYISGLLFALPLLDAGSRIILSTALESSAYVAMTCRTLADFGICVAAADAGFLVPGRQRYHSPGECRIGGDWSNAALWLAMGALSPGGITVRGLDAESLQGDRRILEVLSRFGASIHFHGNGDVMASNSGSGELHGADVDMREIPDLLPVLAVLATAASTPSNFTHAGRLRLKESDRLEGTARLIADLGGHAEVFPDGLRVMPGRLRGGAVDSQNDHRLAMAAVLASARCDSPVMLDGAQSCRKSYPALWRDFSALGGRFQ